MSAPAENIVSHAVNKRKILLMLAVSSSIKVTVVFNHIEVVF